MIVVVYLLENLLDERNEQLSPQIMDGLMRRLHFVNVPSICEEDARIVLKRICQGENYQVSGTDLDAWISKNYRNDLRQLIGQFESILSLSTPVSSPDSPEDVENYSICDIMYRPNRWTQAAEEYFDFDDGADDRPLSYPFMKSHGCISEISFLLDGRSRHSLFKDAFLEFEEVRRQRMPR